MEYRILMLKYESGETVPIPAKPDALSSENIIIVIDEFSKVIWLWLGAQSRKIFKMGAIRKARSFLGMGAQYKDMTIGFGCQTLKIIDETNLDDPVQKADYDELKKFLSRVKLIDGVLAAVPAEAEAPVPPVEKPAPKKVELSPPVEKPTPTEHIKPEEVVSPEQVSKETITPPPSEVPKPEVKREPIPPAEISIPPTPLKLPPEIKAGILIYAILEKFPELYIAKHGNQVVVEGEIGTLTSFKLISDGLELSEDYDFAGKQNEVLDKYNELVNKLKK